MTPSLTEEGGNKGHAGVGEGGGWGHAAKGSPIFQSPPNRIVKLLISPVVLEQ